MTPPSVPAPKKRWRFFVTSLGIGVLGLLCLLGSAAVFVSHLVFSYDIVDFIAVPILLSAGVWTHAFAAVVALVGLFIPAERRIFCALALAVNLVPPLVALAILMAGLVFTK
jgi:hypothetical protein